MKCHYTYDKKTGKKFFIPMCSGTIYSHDKKDCYCQEPLTVHRFEKERFNKIVKEKNQTIKDMESELSHLREVIELLKKLK